jgi:hypothetical protein
MAQAERVKPLLRTRQAWERAGRFGGRQCNPLACFEVYHILSLTLPAVPHQ